MVGDLPSDFGESSTNRPPAEGWTPASCHSASRHAHSTWPAIALAAIALVVAVVALIVALTNSTPAAPPRYDHGVRPTPLPRPPRLNGNCATRTNWRRGPSRSTRTAVTRHWPASRLTNAAVMLDDAAANPALDAKHRDAARALATAYLTVTAKGSSDIATDAEFRAALDDVVAKDAAMKQVCGGG